MEAREIIKKVMTVEEVTNAELARRLDVTPTTVGDRLNIKKGRKNIPVFLLKTMLSVLGYKIVCSKTYLCKSITFANPRNYY